MNLRLKRYSIVYTKNKQVVMLPKDGQVRGKDVQARMDFRGQLQSAQRVPAHGHGGHRVAEPRGRHAVVPLHGHGHGRGGGRRDGGPPPGQAAAPGTVRLRGDV